MKRKVDLIVIHCSASKETVHYSFAQCCADHRARGFNACGYHYFIARDGTIHIGRNLYVSGAHVAGHNTTSVGICYEGGLDKNGKAKDTRTEAQKESIIRCITEAVAYGQGQVKRICGHRELSPDTNGNGVVEPHEWVKVCPCFEVTTEYNYLIK
jgi:N-acetylmuramoyl-L-alanine amidase